MGGIKHVGFLLALSFSNFWITMPALTGPQIFSQQQELQGMDESESGLLFTMMSVPVFILCPFVGLLSGKFTGKFLIVSGCFITGVTLLIFGFVPEFQSYSEETRKGLFMLIGVISGLGTALSLPSARSLLADVYADDFSTMNGIVAMFRGFACVIGPIAGEYVFTAGGVSGFFCFLGCGLLLNCLILGMTEIPAFAATKAPVKDVGESCWHKYKKLLNVRVLFGIVASFLPDFMLMYTSTVFPNWLMDEAHGAHSAAAVGWYYAIASISFMIGCFLGGILVDMCFDPEYLVLFGCFMSSIWPFTFLTDNDKIVIWSQILLGVGLSFMHVCSSTAMLDSVREYGSEAMGTVSGFMNSASSLGDTIAPFMGGAVCKSQGVGMGSAISGIIELVYPFVSIPCIVFGCFKLTYRQDKKAQHIAAEEKASLVQDNENTKADSPSVSYGGQDEIILLNE